MTTIQLKRTITGEYNARRYDLTTDTDFTVAKDAIKAAGGKFESDDKSWKVTGDIIKALRLSGYTITEKSPFFQADFVEQNVRDGGETSTYVVGFMMMQENRPRTSGNLTITFATDAVATNAEIERINAQMSTVSVPSAPLTLAKDSRRAVRALARKAANEAAALVEARTLELLSVTKRSKEEYIAVLKQVISEFGIQG